mmetsp:Transcript_30765/g.27983  ORF Transcript_30765/g.27983 Transcript_30765/m.27983 type:complete len:84 (+) Transcript_30765:398-649(+)
MQGQSSRYSYKENFKQRENRDNPSQSVHDYASERLNNIARIKEDHKLAMADAYYQREMEECSFNPKINDSQRSRRDLDKFLED